MATRDDFRQFGTKHINLAAVACIDVQSKKKDDEQVLLYLLAPSGEGRMQLAQYQAKGNEAAAVIEWLENGR